MAEYVTSDHHFGHKNIIDYEDRPFKTVELMDKELISRWNTVVSKRDTVFHLGDFSFCNKADTEQIVNALNGRKILVMGNHDKAHSVKWWKDVGFNEVYEFPICVKEFVWLSHEPMYMNHHMPYCNVHGHLHTSSVAHHEFDGTTLHYNVCVEMTNYIPLRLDDVLTKIKDVN